MKYLLQFLALALLPPLTGCAWAQAFASSIELGYGVGQGSIDAKAGRAGFDTEQTTVWISGRPLAVLEAPTQVREDPQTTAALEQIVFELQRGRSMGGAIGSIVVQTSQASEQKAAQETKAESAPVLPPPAEPAASDEFVIDWSSKGVKITGVSVLIALFAGIMEIVRRKKKKSGTRQKKSALPLLLLLPLLQGCPSLSTKDFDAAHWERQMDLMTLNLQDAQDIAQDASLKAVFARASQATSLVSEALERYQALGGDDLSKVELLQAFEVALTTLDEILADNPDNADLRAGLFLVKVALRQMSLYVQD